MKQVAIISPLEESFPLDLSSYKFLSPRYGSVAVASYLAAHGYRARVFCEHSHGAIDWDYVGKADYVAFSILSFCASRAYRLTEKVRSINDSPIIYGGNHASVQPSECAAHADYVVRKEGEATILDLLRKLDAGDDVASVPGISYRCADGEVRHNPNRPFMDDLNVVTDFSLVHDFGPMTWRRNLKDLASNFVPHVNLPFVMASRGCPYNCRFCFTTRELGKEYRLRAPEVVTEEIQSIVRLTRSRVVFFADADLLIHREHASRLLELMAQRFRGELEFIIFSRVQVAEDEEMQALLKRANVVTLCIGTETTREETLKEYGKRIDLEVQKEGFKRLRKAGFNVYTSFIFGGEEDTERQIEEAVDFALDSGVQGIGLHPLYDFPGQADLPGGVQMIDDSRFIHHDWRFFNGNFVVYYPNRMRPSRLQKAIQDGYINFYDRCKDSLYQYRPVFLTYRRYMQWLASKEEGLYTSTEELREELIHSNRPQDTKVVPIDTRGLSVKGHALWVMLRNLVRPASWRALRHYGGSSGRLPTVGE